MSSIAVEPREAYAAPPITLEFSPSKRNFSTSNAPSSFGAAVDDTDDTVPTDCVTRSSSYQGGGGGRQTVSLSTHRTLTANLIIYNNQQQ